MTKDSRYIIRIDDYYLVGFEGKRVFGKTSHCGWDQRATELGAVELSANKNDAKVIEGNINLKSGLNKLYDRMRYSDFDFDHLEVFRQ